MDKKADPGSPSKIWYVGHAFFWVITGLICFILWEEKNPDAARRHLIHSIWIGVVIPVVLSAVFMAALLIIGADIPDDQLLPFA